MRETRPSTIEVHVSAVIFSRSFSKVLMLKRSHDRAMYPGKWEGVGGQVYPRESFGEAIRRVASDETGLLVEPFAIVGTYRIPGSRDALRGRDVAGVRFVCEADLRQPIRISPQHTAFARLEPGEALKLDLIPTLADDLRACIAFTKLGRLPFLFY